MLALFGFGLFRALARRKPSARSALGRPDMIVGAALLCVFAAALVMAWRLPQGASPAPLIVTVLGILLSGLIVVLALRRSGPEREPLETFDWLPATALYCAAVPFAGLPLASAGYTVALLVRLGVQPVWAAGWGIALAAAQLGLLSLVLDLRAEPLISGWILWWLQNPG